GEGHVITARFRTRLVEQMTRVMLADGNEIAGTTVHPVWSADRQDWVALSELQVGEHLQSRSGTIEILRVESFEWRQPVYNLEIHAENVYEIGNAGILVHNTGVNDCPGNASSSVGRDAGPKNFEKNNPQYKGTHEIHHSREWNVLERYPGTFSPAELNLESMMRPILKGLKPQGKSLHGSHTRKSWDVFQRQLKDRFDSGEISVETMQKLINWHADYMDRMYLGIN
ncbi:MAG: hypothetical protein KDB00_24395, partial [Planctomycetales bacterium]|nr:hypothetical protein [Planctomycetales bacterium]